MNRRFPATTIVVMLAIVCCAPVCADGSPPLAVAPFSADQARDFQQQWAEQIGWETGQTNSIGMKMVLLPPGEFTMGRTEEQFDHLLEVVKNDPKMGKNYGGFVTWSMLMMPAHRVRITKPFYIGETEATVGQFRQFVAATGYKTEAEQGLNHGKPYKGGRPLSTWREPMAWRKPPFKQKDDEPVMHLCWNDCVAFCEWLSEKEGVQYCLPTEAEWEYACRAGTTTPWSFGDTTDFDREGNKHAIWSDGGHGGTFMSFDIADTAESRRNAYGWLVGKISNRFYAQHFVTDILSKLRSEAGVEPDMIPVTGAKGKELATDGMVLIKGGEFVRPGEYFISNYVTEPTEVKGDTYRVNVSSFYIDKYKVTNQQYCDFLNDGNEGYWTPWNPRIVKNRRGLFVPADPLLADIHVVSVHWFQAAGYAKWAGRRLPTEAEWEFAAAGPEGRKYPWGNEEPDKTRANFRSNRHTPGEAFPAGATPDGVFDLAGNSAEWIADFYDEDYYRKAPPGGVLVDPKGPTQGSARKSYRRMFKGICKGFESPNMLCVFKRHSRPPLLPASAGIGFRCVKSTD